MTCYNSDISHDFNKKKGNKQYSASWEDLYSACCNHLTFDRNNLIDLEIGPIIERVYDYTTKNMVYTNMLNAEKLKLMHQV